MREHDRFVDLIYIQSELAMNLNFFITIAGFTTTIINAENIKRYKHGFVFMSLTDLRSFEFLNVPHVEITRFHAGKR